MKLHLLVFSLPKNPESKVREAIDLLVDAAKRRGHDLQILEANKCRLTFGKKPTVEHEGKKVRSSHALIRATFAAHRAHEHVSLLSHFELAGIRLINSSCAVRCAKDKVLSLQTLSKNNIPIPKTFVIRSSQTVEEAGKDIGNYPLIIKQVAGFGGVGVSIVESKRSLRSFVDMLTNDEHGHNNPLIVQEYFKEARGRDIRVFVVGGKVVAAMERIAKKRGEFRSNFTIGGKVRIAELSAEEKKIALKAARVCGLEIAGVDILRTKKGPQVLEVNSNPGLSGITQATGIDVAGAQIDYLVAQIEKDKKEKSKKA